jgi:hypothetical protein
MIFLRFGKELVNLSQVYQIDLKSGEAGVGVQIAFFYHLAGTTSGGYKLSNPFTTPDDALAALDAMGVEIKEVNPSPYYVSIGMPPDRTNTRIEPTRHKK